MYNISFRTKLKGETVVEGFTTSMSPNISHALSHFEDEVGLDDCDTIELVINPLAF